LATISLTRRLALNLKSVMRRAFGSRGLTPAVCFTAVAGTLSVKAKSHDAAIEYRGPTDSPDETLWVPLKLLEDCSAKRDEPVRVEAAGKGRVTAQWHDGAVPKVVEYTVAKPRDADDFPAPPKNFTENHASFPQAFTEASDTADPGSARYALGNVRLRGENGSLAATDGRQLLLRSGFRFPWTGDVLVPRTKVFTSPELPSDQPVAVGKTEKWVTVGLGPWFIHLRIDEQGRFPNVEKIIRATEEAKGVCRFSRADMEFLAETMPRLPVDQDNSYRVTLDLNGSVAIRAKTPEQSEPTEVVLSNSSWSGEQPIRLNANGKQLARALKLGLSDLYIFGDEEALTWRGDDFMYLSAPLPKDNAIEPATDAIRIESPGDEASTPALPPPIPKTERIIVPVSEPISDRNGNGHAQANGHTNGTAKTNGHARKTTSRRGGQQDINGLIQQAETTRAVLRDALVKSNELVKALKRHRSQSRAIQSTLASLRQLKGLGV
jgi:hypothetical protein